MAAKKKTETAEPIRAVVIGDYNLNVRDGKSTDHKVIGQLKPGTEITILKEGKQWCQIGEGQFVMRRFIDIIR